jgi:iron(III) transport system permease protein
VKSALDLISSEMEDAANILGAGTWKATLKVTLPLVWPSILGGVVVVFLETIALFGTPAIIGIPARINVVTTQLWQFFEYPVRVEVAAAYAMPLLLITMLIIGGAEAAAGPQGLCLANRQGRRAAGDPLGAWRWPIFAYCLLVGALAVVMPLAVLLQASFAKAWGRGLLLDQPHAATTTRTCCSGTRWR